MRLRYFCSPHHTDSALHPVIDQMERAAGLAYDDPPKTQLANRDRGGISRRHPSHTTGHTGPYRGGSAD